MWKVLGTVITTILTVLLSNVFTALLKGDPPPRRSLMDESQQIEWTEAE